MSTSASVTPTSTLLQPRSLHLADSSRETGGQITLKLLKFSRTSELHNSTSAFSWLSCLLSWWSTASDNFSKPRLRKHFQNGSKNNSLPANATFEHYIIVSLEMRPQFLFTKQCSVSTHVTRHAGSFRILHDVVVVALHSHPFLLLLHLIFIDSSLIFPS